LLSGLPNLKKRNLSTRQLAVRIFPMDIVLIGSGNVATVLGRKSLASGHRIIQVYSRQQVHANTLASRLGSEAISSVSSIERNADLMIIALRDEALAPFIKSLGETKSVVTHTAGAISINEIRSTGASYGVLYPIQSLRKEIEIIPPLTLLIDGNKPETRARLKEFASTIAEIVMEADDETRLKYHLAATLVNNFTNHLFTLAATFCEKENISFAVLQPLMEETVLRIRNISPAAAQTGPAIRNDQHTLQKHRELLKNYPAIARFYELFTEEIQKFALSVTR
jgi:predicted short-subunit dehydrogenase-like oxidoreductase (DUF2520 family)